MSLQKIFLKYIKIFHSEEWCSKTFIFFNRDTVSGCHWFEIEFLHRAVITSIKIKGWKTKYLSGNHHIVHSPFLEQTLGASDIEDSYSVCWTNHFLLMYHRDNDWHYYGSDSNL